MGKKLVICLTFLLSMGGLISSAFAENATIENVMEKLKNKAKPYFLIKPTRLKRVGQIGYKNFRKDETIYVIELNNRRYMRDNAGGIYVDYSSFNKSMVSMEEYLRKLQEYESAYKRNELRIKELQENIKNSSELLANWAGGKLYVSNKQVNNLKKISSDNNSELNKLKRKQTAILLDIQYIKNHIPKYFLKKYTTTNNATNYKNKDKISIAAGNREKSASGHIRLINNGVEEKYAKAIENLLETAYTVYTKKLGLSLPNIIKINLSLNPNSPRNLSTDGEGQIFFQIGSIQELYPDGGTNVYGICHEIGHIAIGSRIRYDWGISNEIDETLAGLCGSIVCDYVFDEKGPNLWPVPYDYKKREGSARARELLSKLGQNDAASKDMKIAFKGIWSLYFELGEKDFFSALNNCLEKRPAGRMFLPSFLSEIRKKKPDISHNIFPKHLMESPGEWIPRKPDLEAPALFKELQCAPTKDNTTMLWYYSKTPTPKYMESRERTAFFQLFRLPWNGKGILYSVEIFGRRHGNSSKVIMWICDLKMRVIAEEKFSSQELNWKSGWHILPIKHPVDVPQFFTIGIFFVDADAYKGFYMGYRKDVSGHSYLGSPRQLYLLENQDWAFRVNVGKTERKTHREFK